ncbi:MAG: SDR family oxidoreductase [Candidatus Heimdallarchaeota archaeon]|nr:SDR family oxidoreductase [Candidatus Heimdallarchaeota archaeon]
MDLQLKGKHILVTGASGGIGRAIVKLLYEERASITLQVFQNIDGARNFLLEYKEKERINLVKADLRKEADVSNLFAIANEKLGRIDGLVANAGIWPNEAKFTSELSLEQWNNTLNVNLTGVFLCVKEFFKNLQEYPENQASIVLIGSTAGLFGEAGHADYSATKSALMYGLTKTWKNEIVHFASEGRVNTVAPGWTYTPMAEGSLKNKEEVKNILQTIPLRKIASVDDIASAVLFLLSDKFSGHISGETLMVDGGMEGRRLFNKDQISMDFLKKLFKDK